jgi:hypothetical protein
VTEPAAGFESTECGEMNPVAARQVAEPFEAEQQPPAIEAAHQGRRAFLVLGMHRSGTSAVTSALHKLGAQLPARILPVMPDNPEGFFEPREIVAIHDRLLASAGSSWLDCTAFPETWYSSADAEAFVNELIAALQQDYGDAALFVLKDPRISRFAPLWFKVFSALQITPFVVLPLRNPVEVAESLRKRDRIPFAHSYLLWLRHVLDAEFTSRNYPRIFLNYPDFVEASGREIDRILPDLPLHRSRLSPGVIQEIENSVNADLRHNATTYDEMIQRADIFGWLRDAYDAHGQLCVDPHDAEAMRTLDRIRAQFNIACEAFGPFVEALKRSVTTEAEARQVAEDRAVRIPALESELRLNQERADDLERIALCIAPLEQRLHDAQAEADRLRGEIALRIPPLEQRLHDAEAEADRLRGEIALRLPPLEQRLRDAEAKADRLRGEVAEAREGAELLRALLAKAHRETELLRDVLDAVRRVKSRPEGLLRRIVRRVYWAISFQLPRRMRAERLIARRMQIALQSSLFDPQWYERTYPDVIAAGLDPLRHFCAFGLYEGRSPGPSADLSSLQALRRRFEDLE